jgi:hypothetical protein
VLADADAGAGRSAEHGDEGAEAVHGKPVRGAAAGLLLAGRRRDLRRSPGRSRGTAAQVGDGARRTRSVRPRRSTFAPPPFVSDRHPDLRYDPERAIVPPRGPCSACGFTPGAELREVNPQISGRSPTMAQRDGEGAPGRSP